MVHDQNENAKVRKVDSRSKRLGLNWNGSYRRSRLNISNNSNRFVAMVTSLNGVAKTLAIVAELFVGLLAMIARAREITWLLRLLYRWSRRSNSQNIELILGLKGCKMSFFSNQLVHISIKRGSRTAIKKLTSNGLKILVKWNQEFIEAKFITNGSILLSILWACPSCIRKVNLVLNEAKLIIVVIDGLP